MLHKRKYYIRGSIDSDRLYMKHMRLVLFYLLRPDRSNDLIELLKTYLNTIEKFTR